MGNYNTQYQSYYNNLAKKQRGANKFSSEGNNNGSRISQFYVKRLTKELIGVLILFIFVLLLKVVVTPKTQYAFNYSKQVINKQYDYSNLIDKAKGVKLKDIEVITVNFLEKIKNTITNGNEINSTKDTQI